MDSAAFLFFAVDWLWQKQKGHAPILFDLRADFVAEFYIIQGPAEDSVVCAEDVVVIGIDGKIGEYTSFFIFEFYVGTDKKKADRQRQMRVGQDDGVVDARDRPVVGATRFFAHNGSNTFVLQFCG